MKAELDRIAARDKENDIKEGMKKIIKRYDTNGSGRLERDQVIKMLTEMDTSTPPDTAPTDEQVNFLFQIADKAQNQAIDSNELGELLTCWRTFMDNRERFESAIQKYDVSNTGTLSKAEVKAYLTDLNGGQEVTDKEVEMVMKHGDVLNDGVLNHLELQRATAMWYGYVEQPKTSTCCCMQ
jgi:Ca2+-binding EF-hand superfamily protein